MQVQKPYASIALLAICCFLGGKILAQPMEEFNGPYASWANVKLRFGAKGNGNTDDTKALQQAIDQLGVTNSQGTRFTVLYLPAGIYNIAGTLVLKGKIGVSIIGENPATTIIRWTNPVAATMLFANGSAFYKISRLTWDANSHKGMEGIGIHWRDRWNDGKTQSYASLNIEISDNIFTGGFNFGISGGTNAGEGTNNNDSEIAIKRCEFRNCTDAGIATTGYNALDYWIWDCRFLSCNTGITSRYGNFHAYRCYFKKSLRADVTNYNGYYKSMRGCYSEDGQALMWDEGFNQNPFKRIFQGNTVVRPINIPIQMYHWGRLAFFDNVFDKSIDTNVTMFVKTTSSIISVHNTYRNKTPATLINGAVFNQFNDVYNIKPFGNGAVFLQSQAKTPLFVSRQVIEVPLNADEDAIQQIINTAAKLKGKRPVVHFAPGTYTIGKTLLVPADADLQLTGDGPLNASVLLPAKNFAAGAAMLRVMGPTAITIREIQIGNFTNTMSAIDAVWFEHADQQGSQAYIDQLYTVGNNAIRGEGLDYLRIQKDNSFFADNDFISGGPVMQTGKGTAGIFGFGGQFAGVSVQNNAKAVYKDCWWEGKARLALRLSGSGSLTIDGAMLAPSKADSMPTVSISTFRGSISLLNMYIQGAISLPPDNAGLKLLVMNTHFYHKLDPLSFINKTSSFQGVFTGLTSECFISGDQKCGQIFQLKDTTNNVSDATAFVPQLLADDLHALPLKYEKAAAGASSIFISRTSLGDVNNAVKFSK